MVSRAKAAKTTNRSSRATPTVSPIPAAQPARMMFSSEKKMLKGGNPTRATMAISQGTARPGRRNKALVRATSSSIAKGLIR